MIGYENGVMTANLHRCVSLGLVDSFRDPVLAGGEDGAPSGMI